VTSNVAATSASPRVVFVTTCRNRTQHLENTLPRNIADNSDYPNAKFVILDYASADHLLPFLQINHGQELREGKLVFYRYFTQSPFKMAHAKNLAHRLGMREGADILVNLDADNLTKAGFASYVADQFKEPRVFLWSGIVRGLGKRFRGCSGRIVVTPQAFLKAGGYDEKYDTWAPDDKDFNARLQLLGLKAKEIEKRYLEAVWHSDGLRFREYPHARILMQNDDPSSDPYDLSILPESPIANAGRVGLGTVYRNFDPTPIELKPIPTRIFGIGMHKTATSSLHSALKILGFDSAHWESGEWAKTIWREMRKGGRSRTLEKSYALSDLPITLLYRELDRAYPRSKFILTIRSEESWLQSVCNHWSYERNPFRAEWDLYPFSNQIHQALYGQKGYDALVMLARYRRHNREVMEYFKGRPDDLLVLDMEKGDGWPQLCSFLNVPFPSSQVEYPRELVTQRLPK
jgi:hypothetical protein